MPFTWPSPLAEETNAQGLRAHRRGRFRTSKTLFQKAVELAPSFDLARYNLACALARLGQSEEAFTSLDLVLRHDYPVYSKKAVRDPDLATLRAGAARRRFDGLLAEISVHWRRAAVKGIPGVVYRDASPKEPRDDADNDDDVYLYTAPAQVRVVVYLPNEKRLVPLALPRVGAMSGLADVASGRTWALFGRGFFPSGGSLEDIRLESADLLGNELRSKRPSDTGLLLRAVDVLLDADEIRLRPIEQRGYDPVTFAPHIEGAALHAFRIAPEGPYYLGGGANAFSLDGAALHGPGGKKQALSGNHSSVRHRAFARSPDGAHLWIVSIRTGCRWRDVFEEGTITIKGTPFAEHVIERVDWQTGTTEIVSSGAEVPFVRSLPDARVLIQIGKHTRLLEDPRRRLESAVTLPDEFFLTVPPRPLVCIPEA